jgi:DNA-binding NarL/FixJ family response regulator
MIVVGPQFERRADGRPGGVMSESRIVDSAAVGAEAACCCNRLHLTGREVDVLVQLAAGRDNHEVASALGISAATVAHHVASMMHRTGARNRTALVSWSVFNGVLQTADWPFVPSGRSCLASMGS